MAQITYTPNAEFSDGETIEFTAAPLNKVQLLGIGLDYYNATEKKQDEMLEDFGGTAIRRALLAFAKVANNRYGMPEVQKAAMAMRDEIIPAGQANKQAAA